VYVVYLDFSRASTTFFRNILYRLMNYELDKQAVRWTENWLNFRAFKGLLSAAQSPAAVERSI